jgi:polysaccharide transporter, PST family
MPTDPNSNSPDRLSATFSAAGLRQAVRAGTRRTAVAQAASHVVSLVVLGTLMRLVGPDNFGLVAMVMSLLLLMRIVTSLGLNVATIQQRELAPGQASTLFWLHMALGTATAVATAGLAPAVAWFYGHAELIGLTLGLAGTSIVVALSLQHVALLERNLRLGRAAWARVGGQVIGGAAAVAAALAGAGVWSLVIQQYVEFTALAVLAWSLEPWRPSTPWAGEPARDMIHFGGRVAASSVLMYLLNNADKVLVGVALGPLSLGYYSQAFNVMMKPVFVLTTPLISIMLPALSRAAHEQESFRRLVLAFLRVVALASFPTSVGLALTAREAMRVIGGEQWSEAGVLLAALSATILAQAFVILTGTIYMSRGLSRPLLLAVMAMTIAVIAGIAVGFEWGRRFDRPALGVALGYSLTMCLVVLVPYVSVCLRSVGVAPRDWLVQLRSAALAALAMGAIVWLCRQGLVSIASLPPVGLLAAEITIGVTVYLVLARGEVRWCLDQLRRL